VLLQAADYDDALAYFQKHDVKVIFWGRFVPGVRSLIFLPAGVARMPFGRFALYALLGTALLMAGWFLGERWQLVLDVVDRLEFVAWGLLAAAVVAWVVWRRGEGAAAEPQAVP
jgi:membrane protein DedA with SNARE-associated domain